MLSYSIENNLKIDLEANKHAVKIKIFKQCYDIN